VPPLLPSPQLLQPPLELAGPANTPNFSSLPPTPYQSDPHLLQLWQQLVVRPDVALAAGGALRGLPLLRVVHSLVEALQSGALPAARLDATAATTALLLLLEISDSLGG
jgi:hypothetical protein